VKGEADTVHDRGAAKGLDDVVDAKKRFGHEL
jgi:hypothetical protein